MDFIISSICCRAASLLLDSVTVALWVRGVSCGVNEEVCMKRSSSS